jgi:endo-1,4-beta-xylanase
MDGMSEKADRCYLWIKELLARGVPIHGLGLAVHITELDVWLPKGVRPSLFERQAAVYREIFETALAAPRCPAVFLWGFTDRYSWVPGISKGAYDQALIFDREYRPKPAYEAIAAALR